MANHPSAASAAADAAGFKLFGQVIQPPDAPRTTAEEIAPPPQFPSPSLPSPPPRPPPTPAPPAATPVPVSVPLKASAEAGAAGGAGEPLPCPRCGSRETKFCYFNNYNVRQPRHLCRACRRYWTAGGALRRVSSASPGRRRPRPAARSAASPAVASTAAAAPPASAAEGRGGER